MSDKLKSEELTCKFLDYCKGFCNSGNDISDVFRSRFAITNPNFIYSKDFRESLGQIFTSELISPDEQIKKFIKLLNLLKEYQILSIENYQRKHSDFNTITSFYEDMEIRLIKNAFKNINSNNSINDLTIPNITCSVQIKDCANIVQVNKVKLINLNSVFCEKDESNSKNYQSISTGTRYILPDKNENVLPENVVNMPSLSDTNLCDCDTSIDTVLENDAVMTSINDNIHFDLCNHVIQRPRQKITIRKLEFLLWKLNKRIKKLEEKELSLDDLWDESYYILCDKYKNKAVKVWLKLCELRKQSASLDRIMHRKFTYSGSKYSDINQKVSDFINKTKKFPDFQDIFELVTNCNRTFNLNIRKWSLTRVSEKIFLEICEILKQKRISDFHQNFGSFLTDNISCEDDPAIANPILRKKLINNKIMADSNMAEVLDRFVRFQNNGKKFGNESSDDDDRSSQDNDADSRTSDSNNCEITEDNIDSEMLLINNDELGNSEDEGDVESDEDGKGGKKISIDAGIIVTKNSETECCINLAGDASNKDTHLNNILNKNVTLLDDRPISYNLVDESVNKIEDSNSPGESFLNLSILGYISEKSNSQQTIGDLSFIKEADISNLKYQSNQRVEVTHIDDSPNSYNSDVLLHDAVINDDIPIIIIDENDVDICDSKNNDLVIDVDIVQNNTDKFQDHKKVKSSAINTQITRSLNDVYAMNPMVVDVDEVTDTLILDSPNKHWPRNQKCKYISDVPILTEQHLKEVTDTVKQIFGINDIHEDEFIRQKNKWPMKIRNLSNTFSEDQSYALKPLIYSNLNKSQSKYRNFLESHSLKPYDQYSDVTSTTDVICLESEPDLNPILFRADYLRKNCNQNKANQMDSCPSNKKPFIHVANYLNTSNNSSENVYSNSNLNSYMHPVRKRLMENPKNFLKNKNCQDINKSRCIRPNFISQNKEQHHLSISKTVKQKNNQNELNNFNSTSSGFTSNIPISSSHFKPKKMSYQCPLNKFSKIGSSSFGFRSKKLGIRANILHTKNLYNENASGPKSAKLMRINSYLTSSKNPSNFSCNKSLCLNAAFSFTEAKANSSNIFMRTNSDISSREKASDCKPKLLRRNPESFISEPMATSSRGFKSDKLLQLNSTMPHQNSLAIKHFVVID